MASSACSFPRAADAARFGAPLTPEIAGASVVELVRADAATLAPGYLLTGAGLKPLA